MSPPRDRYTLEAADVQRLDILLQRGAAHTRAPRHSPSHTRRWVRYGMLLVGAALLAAWLLRRGGW